jgi:hypothetical protein
LSDLPKERAEASTATNPYAFLSLMTGVAACVPWMVVILGPLALVFSVMAWGRAIRTGNRRHLGMAAVGFGLTTLSMVVQLGLGLLAWGLGWLGKLVGM